MNHYKRLINFRNSHPVLNDNLSRLEQTGIRQKGTVSFIRRSGHGQRVLVVHNLTRNPIAVVFSPGESWCQRVVFATVPGSSLSDNRVTIPAYGCVVMD